MNFITDQVKKLSDSKPEEPDHNKPVEGGQTPASSSELMASAKVVAEAAQAATRNETDKLDKGKVAGATADILDAAGKYGKFDEKTGTGQYLEKAEKYLNEFESSHSSGTAAAAPPPAAGAPPPEAHAEPETKKPDEESGGGLGGLGKMAQGFMK